MLVSGLEQRIDEIERVKDLVREDREKNRPIYNIKGCRGRSIKVYRDRCIITTDVTLGSLLTSNATDGAKTIFYSDIVGVQYKLSGLTIGYIQLETASGQMNNIASNQFGENTFTFEQNEGIDEVHDYIIYQVSRHKQTFLNFDTFDKYPVYSFKYDTMTPDRRNWIKELHMHHDGDVWDLIIKVQCRAKEETKAILADLEIKNVFGDVFPLKGVQFLFSPDSSTIQASRGWNCQIPDEYARSISEVDIHIRKIAYEGEVIDQEQIKNFPDDVTDVPSGDDSQHKSIEKILLEVSGLRRACDMHDYLLEEIEQGTIALPDVDLADLVNTVAVERMYGAMPDSYVNKLKKILRGLYDGR